MKTIVFASYKGGVGRTLAVANLAHFLASLGQRVVAMDLDLETPGLHFKLEPTRPRLLSSPPGTLDLFESFAARRPLPLDDALCPIDSPVARGRGAISFVGAGTNNDGYWRRLASFPWRRLLAGGAPHEPALPHIDLRAGEALLSMQAELELTTDTDVWLIDAPAGLSELADLAASLLADEVVLLSANNRESLSGTSALVTALTSAPRLPREDGSPRPLRVVPVISRVPAVSADDERAMLREVAALLRCSANGPVHRPSVLHECPALAARERVVLASAERTTARERSGCARIAADYLRLFSRLVPEGLLEDQLRERSEHALRAAYDHPEQAAAAIEDLAARFPHPVTLRALLKFQRLTGTLTASTLAAVSELVAATGDPAEPLVVEVVRACAPMLDKEPAADAAWRDVIAQVATAAEREVERAPRGDPMTT